MNADFGSLHAGHLQVSGSMLKGVPGGIFCIGSPFSGYEEDRIAFRYRKIDFESSWCI